MPFLRYQRTKHAQVYFHILTDIVGAKELNIQGVTLSVGHPELEIIFRRIPKSSSKSARHICGPKAIPMPSLEGGLAAHSFFLDLTCEGVLAQLHRCRLYRIDTPFCGNEGRL